MVVEYTISILFAVKIESRTSDLRDLKTEIHSNNICKPFWMDRKVNKQLEMETCRGNTCGLPIQKHKCRNGKNKRLRCRLSKMKRKIEKFKQERKKSTQYLKCLHKKEYTMEKTVENLRQEITKLKNSLNVATSILIPFFTKM